MGNCGVNCISSFNIVLVCYYWNNYIESKVLVLISNHLIGKRFLKLRLFLKIHSVIRSYYFSSFPGYCRPLACCCKEHIKWTNMTINMMLLSEYTLDTFILGDNDESTQWMHHTDHKRHKTNLPMWERLKSNIAVSSGLSCREYSTTFNNP